MVMKIKIKSQGKGEVAKERISEEVNRRESVSSKIKIRIKIKIKKVGKG